MSEALPTAVRFVINGVGVHAVKVNIGGRPKYAIIPFTNKQRLVYPGVWDPETHNTTPASCLGFIIFGGFNPNNRGRATKNQKARIKAEITKRMLAAMEMSGEGCLDDAHPNLTTEDGEMSTEEKSHLSCIGVETALIQSAADIGKRLVVKDWKEAFRGVVNPKYAVVYKGEWDGEAVYTSIASNMSYPLIDLMKEKGFSIKRPPQSTWNKNKNKRAA